MVRVRHLSLSLLEADTRQIDLPLQELLLSGINRHRKYTVIIQKLDSLNDLRSIRQEPRNKVRREVGASSRAESWAPFFPKRRSLQLYFYLTLLWQFCLRLVTISSNPQSAKSFLPPFPSVFFEACSMTRVTSPVVSLVYRNHTGRLPHELDRRNESQLFRRC